MNISLTKAKIDAEDFRVMEEAVRSRAVTQGDVTSAFETRFARQIGAVGGIATNSGTSALILALRTLGVGNGDEVIVPSFTCLAVLHAVVQVGATPVLSDNICDPGRMDYNMTAEQVRRVLTVRTKAIIVPHMFGVPAKIDDLLEIEIPVIEDITLSVGARHKQIPVGSWAALSACSFHASKMIACGEGGMVTASSHELYERARFLNGWESEQVSLRFSRVEPPPYELRYNFRLSDIAAALGLSQLQRLPEFVERRRSLAQLYTERLKSLGNVITPVVDETPNVFFRYLIFLKNLDVIHVLNAYAKAGIEAGRGVYPALHRHLREDRARFPGAEEAMSALLSIPLYPALTDEEVEYILDCTVDILSERCKT